MRFAAALIVIFSAGCWTQTGAVLERHSREYGCPASEIEIEDLGSFAYRATGCGHQVSYQCADNSQYSGKWCIPVGRNTGGGEAPVVAVSGASLQPTSPEPPVQAEAGRQLTGVDALRARLDARAPRILACLDVDTAVVRLRWGGDVTIALDVRGVSDPTLLECARAAFGRVNVPAGVEPGEILHAISL